MSEFAGARAPLRLALVTSSYAYIEDGVALTLNRLVRYLEGRGVEVLVFTPAPPRRSLPHAGRIEPVPSAPMPVRPEYRLTFGLPRAQRERMRAFAPDIVHIATPDFLGHAALKFARALGVPVVASFHTRYDAYLKHYGLGFLEPEAARRLRRFHDAFDEVYAPSASMLEALTAEGARNVRLWPRASTPNASIPAPVTRPGARRGDRPGSRRGGVRRAPGAREGLAAFAGAAPSCIAKELDHAAIAIGEGPDEAMLRAAAPRRSSPAFCAGRSCRGPWRAATSSSFRAPPRPSAVSPWRRWPAGCRRSAPRPPAAARWCATGSPVFSSPAIPARRSPRRCCGSGGRGPAAADGRGRPRRATEFSWDAAMEGLLARYRRLTGKREAARLPSRRSLRLVDVCGFYSDQGGGVRGYVARKIAAAAAHGHHVSVIAPGRENRIEQRDGGRIVWVASPPMPSDRRYRRFDRAAPVWRAIDAERPDILEGSTPWRGGWLARDWPGRAPRALIFHQDFVAAYPQPLLDRFLSHDAIDRLFAPWWANVRRLSQGFDVTVTAGDWLAARLARLGIARPVSIPFGVEPNRFSPRRRDEALRADLLRGGGVGPEGRLLLAVGRFHPEKRWGVILEGFRRARATRGIWFSSASATVCAAPPSSAPPRASPVSGCWARSTSVIASPLSTPAPICWCTAPAPRPTAWSSPRRSPRACRWSRPTAAAPRTSPVARTAASTAPGGRATAPAPSRNPSRPPGPRGRRRSPMCRITSAGCSASTRGCWREPTPERACRRAADGLAWPVAARAAVC